jgi:sodium-coupled neutral amino acid transporter 11
MAETYNPITSSLINDEGEPAEDEEFVEDGEYDEDEMHRNVATSRDSMRSVKSYLSNKTEEEIQDIKSRYSHMSVLSVHEIANSAGMTLFLLINTMIGSGILNQPYVFMKSGLIGGLVGFVLAGLGTWAGLLLLTKAGISCNILEYSGLAKFAFGVYGEYSIDLSIILLTFGAQLGYILIVGETSADLLGEWGCDHVMCEQQQITILAVAIFMTPICLFRHFGHLAFLALFSILAIVLCVGLVVVGGPMQHVGNKQHQIKALNAMGAVTSVGSIVFSLSCSAANFQAFISTKLEHQNLRSWSGITGGAVFLGAVMCVIMGIAGYMSFGDDTDGEILSEYLAIIVPS